MKNSKYDKISENKKEDNQNVNTLNINTTNINTTNININEFCKTEEYNLLEINIIKNINKIRGISIIQNKFKFDYNLIPLITSILDKKCSLEIIKKYNNINYITEFSIKKQCLSSKLRKDLNLENYNIYNTIINEKVKSYYKNELNNCVIDITDNIISNSNTLLTNKTYNLGISNTNNLSCLFSYYQINRKLPDIKQNEIDEVIEINFIWNIDNNIKFYITIPIYDINNINSINYNLEYTSKFIVIKGKSKTLNNYENSIIIENLTNILKILNF